jgi:hypothetical protein
MPRAFVRGWRRTHDVPGLPRVFGMKATYQCRERDADRYPHRGERDDRRPSEVPEHVPRKGPDLVDGRHQCADEHHEQQIRPGSDQYCALDTAGVEKLYGQDGAYGRCRERHEQVGEVQQGALADRVAVTDRWWCCRVLEERHEHDRHVANATHQNGGRAGREVGDAAYRKRCV